MVLPGCAQLGAPGYALGTVEPIDNEWQALGPELLIHFYDVLRPTLYALDVERRSSKRYEGNKGYIPLGGAPAIKGRDLCDRRNDPYCKGIAFGEELLAHPRARAAIEDWLLNFCDRAPRVVTEKTSLYYSIQTRQLPLTQLRKLMGCDGAPREPRNIHVYVLRNIDHVFKGNEDHTDKVIQQSIIESRILRINPL